MKKWILLLSPFLLATPLLEGWGGYSLRQSQTASHDASLPDTHFPLNADQGWFVEQSYLLLKPTLGDLEYGNLISAKGDISDLTVKVKSPDFEWNSGVRLGLGRYLPNHDKWDISFYTTYFYGETEDRTKSNLDRLRGLATAYDPFVVILSESTKATWRLNYFVWDLMLGRQFAMTPQIIFHPYIGLRGTVMYTKFRTTNFGDLTLTNPNTGVTATAAGSATVKFHDDFWGIGPRIGTNFGYKFSGNWSFLSNLAASFLYGHYHVKEKINTRFTAGTAALPINAKVWDHDDAIRINLEGAIGLGWEAWFKNNTVRLAPNLQFEGSLWFDMNDFSRPSTVFSQDRGSLGLMGLTFNLQVDF